MRAGEGKDKPAVLERVQLLGCGVAAADNVIAQYAAERPGHPRR